MNKQEKCDERAQIESESGDVQQKSIMPIAFSITNILSSSFGNAKTPTAPGCESAENAGTKRDRILLRLYDNNNADDDEDDEASPKPAKIPRRQQSDDEASNGMCISRFFLCWICYFASGVLWRSTSPTARLWLLCVCAWSVVDAILMILCGMLSDINAEPYKCEPSQRNQRDFRLFMKCV